VRHHQARARQQLRRFRQATAFTATLTALLLVLWSGVFAPAQENLPAEQGPAASEQPAEVRPQDSIAEATGTVRELVRVALAVVPKIAVAVILVALALLAARLVRIVLRRFLHGWERVEAISALTGIGLTLLAVAAGLSVIAGDARALLGSVGLVGLALSWALQTPIESFTGWVLNAFQLYYRTGDRIEVGEVFGDVYRIDILTTTVWQVGGPGKPVGAAQPTGALITFPNWEILRSNIVNYSRLFPYVWDEITVGVTNESDLAYAMQLLEQVANRTVGPMMQEPCARYASLLKHEKIGSEMERGPAVYLSMAEAWTDCTIRYLVPVGQRRHWSSRLVAAVAAEMARPEHRGKVRSAYPRIQMEMLPRAPQPKGDSSPQKSAGGTLPPP
jgi:small-conductance mechanosensitive channel